MDFPRKPSPAVKKEQDWTIVLMRSGDGLLVRRRPKGLLGGLYEFCPVEGHPAQDALVAALSAMGFANPRVERQLPDSRHVFTHRVWRMKGCVARCDAPPAGFEAVDKARLCALPFPSALRVYREIAGELLGDIV